MSTEVDELIAKLVDGFPLSKDALDDLKPFSVEDWYSTSLGRPKLNNTVLIGVALLNSLISDSDYHWVADELVDMKSDLLALNLKQAECVLSYIFLINHRTLSDLMHVNWGRFLILHEISILLVDHISKLRSEKRDRQNSSKDPRGD